MCPGDPRISALFSYPNNWRLVLRDVTYQVTIIINTNMILILLYDGQDSGLYVCQISTHPPKELHIRVTVKGETGIMSVMVFSKCGHPLLEVVIRSRLRSAAAVSMPVNVPGSTITL